MHRMFMFVYRLSYNTPDCANKLNTVRFKAFIHFYDKYCLIHVEYFYVQSMEKRKLINLDVCRQCKQQFVLIFSIPDLKIRDLNCFFNVSINFHGLRENHSFPNLFYLFTLT